VQARILLSIGGGSFDDAVSISDLDDLRALKYANPVGLLFISDHLPSKKGTQIYGASNASLPQGIELL